MFGRAYIFPSIISTYVTTLLSTVSETRYVGTIKSWTSFKKKGQGSVLNFTFRKSALDYEPTGLHDQACHLSKNRSFVAVLVEMPYI